MFTKYFVGYGFILMFGLICGALVGAVFTKAIPLMRLVRSGQVATGKVLRLQVPMQKGYRTPRPFVEFIGPDGHHVRYQDLFADKGVEKPGDSVTVRYDPANPQERATIRGMRSAVRYMTSYLVGAVIFAGLAVIGLLILLDVIPFGTTGSY
jgi:hypothetical protein